MTWFLFMMIIVGSFIIGTVVGGWVKENEAKSIDNKLTTVYEFLDHADEWGIELGQRFVFGDNVRDPAYNDEILSEPDEDDLKECFDAFRRE